MERLAGGRLGLPGDLTHRLRVEGVDGGPGLEHPGARAGEGVARVGHVHALLLGPADGGLGRRADAAACSRLDTRAIRPQLLRASRVMAARG